MNALCFFLGFATCASLVAAESLWRLRQLRRRIRERA